MIYNEFRFYWKRVKDMTEPIYLYRLKTYT